MLGHVVDALHLLEVHDCAKIEASSRLVHEIAATCHPGRRFEVGTLPYHARYAIFQLNGAIDGTAGSLEVESAPLRRGSTGLGDLGREHRGEMRSTTTNSTLLTHVQRLEVFKHRIESATLQEVCSCSTTTIYVLLFHAISDLNLVDRVHFKELQLFYFFTTCEHLVALGLDN